MNARANPFEWLVDEIADRVVAKLRETTPAPSEYVDQASCGFDAKTYVRAARSGAFPASKVGRRWIAKRTDVAFFIESRRAGFINAETDTTELRKKLKEVSRRAS